LGTLPSAGTFMCGHGERAMSAASLAQRSGRHAEVYVGSAERWARKTGRSLVRG
jgi:3-mercaptopyruvate sulfurtransferase SseA